MRLTQKCMKNDLNDGQIFGEMSCIYTLLFISPSPSLRGAQTAGKLMISSSSKRWFVITMVQDMPNRDKFPCTCMTGNLVVDRMPCMNGQADSAWSSPYASHGN
jgi:hypothetical protein